MLIKDELQIYIVPTGKRPGGLTYVLFIVVANAHGEEFHDLPGKIFIGRSFDVHSASSAGIAGSFTASMSSWKLPVPIAWKVQFLE